MAESRLNPREQARLEEKKKSSKVRNRYILFGVLILVMLLLVVFVNSRLFTDGLPALKVGDDKFTVADVNYEYRKSYMQVAQSSNNIVSMFIDSDQPLSEQSCPIDPDCETWDDYFKKIAENNLKEGAAIYKAAREAGYTLTEEEQKDIDSTIEQYAAYGSIYGYPNVNGYLAAMFGPGNNETTVRRNMAREIIIDRYLQDVYDAGEYTDAELDAYYDEHADSFDKVNVLYVYLTGDDAEAKAKQIVSESADGTAEAFRAAVTETAETEATENSYTVTSFLGQYGEAITREEIAPSKTFVRSTDAGSYAVYITGTEDNHYNTVSVRHILVKAQDTDGDGTYSDKELEVAYNAVKAIEDEWLAGEKTEDSFAALATLRTEDQGSAEKGGLYEDIHKGQMVSGFEDFCFAGHQKGDYDIVLGSSDAYTGYHLIYFVGADGELYSRTLAEEDMRSEAYNDAVAKMVEGYEAQRTWMWRYVIKG